MIITIVYSLVYMIENLCLVLVKRWFCVGQVAVIVLWILFVFSFVEFLVNYVILVVDTYLNFGFFVVIGGVKVFFMSYLVFFGKLVNCLCFFGVLFGFNFGCIVFV